MRAGSSGGDTVKKVFPPGGMSFFKSSLKNRFHNCVIMLMSPKGRKTLQKSRETIGPRGMEAYRGSTGLEGKIDSVFYPAHR
jgi:hypothetical protein